jgi:ADP-heptose:LPS heptosyltransferase
MGLGGYLTWTAAAREIVERINVPDIKVMPMEQCADGIIKLIKSEIFENNPNIFQELEEDTFVFPIVLNNPQTNYCKKDTPTYAKHRFDKHIIEQICEVYGIPDPELRCELYFTHEESEKVTNLLSDTGVRQGFMVIEPQSNEEYTVNKLYPLEKWQFVVDELNKNGHQVVQVGRETEEFKLSNVVDLTGITSFREAALVISCAKLFISSEGGLMHAAHAVNTRSVIVYTGFIHPDMTSYKENSNIWIGKYHGPCGMKVRCNRCELDAKNHDPREILDEAVKTLEIV